MLHFRRKTKVLIKFNTGIDFNFNDQYIILVSDFNKLIIILTYARVNGWLNCLHIQTLYIVINFFFFIFLCE